MSRDPIGDLGFLIAHPKTAQHLYSDIVAAQTAAMMVLVVPLLPSLPEWHIRQSEHPYAVVRNSPVQLVDLLGLRCKLYLMMGHFGGRRKNPEGDGYLEHEIALWDGTKKTVETVFHEEAKQASWIYAQLGTSTAPIEDCDATFSLSCHMRQYIALVKANYPGAIVPDRWPPSPYDNDRETYIHDFTWLIKNDHVKSTNRELARQMFGAPCCCDEIELRVLCDTKATTEFDNQVKIGNMGSNPCKTWTGEKLKPTDMVHWSK